MVCGVNRKRFSNRLFLRNILVLGKRKMSVIFILAVFVPGNLCMITGGRNLGRVGTVVSRDRHPGSFDIVHIKDALGHTFATR